MDDLHAAASIVRLAVIGAFASAMSLGCSAQSDGGSQMPRTVSANSQSAEESPGTDPGIAGQGDGVDKSGCSYIQWCDKPNSSWGTVCIQSGCTFQAAYDECIRETYIVCGSPVATWVFVD